MIEIDTLSRYGLCEARTDAEGRLFLTPRVPYRYRDLPDNLVHEVAQGDTLKGLAVRYYVGAPKPARLWWAIADFQPEPIHDPTIRLTRGRKLVIPSLRTIQTRALAESRRDETDP